MLYYKVVHKQRCCLQTINKNKQGMTKKKHEECQAERRVVGLCPTGRFHTIFKRQIQLFQGQWRAVEYLQRIMTWIDHDTKHLLVYSPADRELLHVKWITSMACFAWHFFFLVENLRVLTKKSVLNKTFFFLNNFLIDFFQKQTILFCILVEAKRIIHIEHYDTIHCEH